MRKVYPLNLGGSDTCYFCKKRVYVMERLSAEGHFFHRECFRCSVCATTLRLAAYAFDGDEGDRLPPGAARVSVLASCPFGGSGTASHPQGAQGHQGSRSGILERLWPEGGPLWRARLPREGEAASPWWALALGGTY